MPTRHGKIEQNGGTNFRCEIRGVFNRLPGALIEDIFYASRDASVLTPRTSLNLHTFALREHFQHMAKRLLHSLDALQGGLHTISRLWDDDNRYETIANPGIGVARLKLDTEIAGDAVLHYIAAILDDVARVLPFADPATRDLAWFNGGAKVRCESFAAAVRLTKSNRPLSSLGDVFEGLDDDDSWWSLAFKYGAGSRQRVVHYTDWTAVGPASLSPDAFVTDSEGWGPLPLPPEARLYITRPGEDSAIDFCDRLRLVLFGLCEWLDTLEQRLRVAWIPHELEARAPWLAQSAPLFSLPIADAWWPSRALSPLDDFYLPVCGIASEN